MDPNHLQSFLLCDPLYKKPFRKSLLGGGAGRKNKDSPPLDSAALIIVKSQGKEKNIANV